MELKVYDWEQFDRGKVWFLVLWLIIVWVVVVSVLSKNYFWWVIVLVVWAAYIYFLSKVGKWTTMITWKNVLQIWKQAYPWNTLSWFVLEYHTEKKKIHNIVIINDKKEPLIYTIKDTEKNLENFVNDLNWYIPMLDSYDQDFLSKVLRKLKL